MIKKKKNITKLLLKLSDKTCVDFNIGLQDLQPPVENSLSVNSH